MYLEFIEFIEFEWYTKTCILFWSQVIPEYGIPMLFTPAWVLLFLFCEIRNFD